MSGHIALAIPSSTAFFLGLFLVIIGTGLLKPNISAMVGQLYSADDVRRDAGFSIFYMGINIGAMVAPLVTGFLAQSETFRATLTGWGINPEYSWHFGFGAAAVGMFFGLVWYIVDSRSLGDAGRYPAVSAAETTAARGTMIKAGAIIVGLIAVVAVLIQTGMMAMNLGGIRDAFKLSLIAIVVLFFLWLFFANKWTSDERKRLLVILVLFVGAAVFWSVFEQAGSTLTLFADRNTNNVIFGSPFPSSWWQSVNSGWVVILAPVFAWIWIKLGNHNPSSPTKFMLGLFFASLSFAVMVPAARMSVDGQKVGWIWLMLCYICASVGEMCLSPVGLSAMTKLAPARVGSLMMGVWFMATSVGGFIAGQTAGLYSTLPPAQLFAFGAGYAMLFAVILALLIRPINRMLARQE